MKVFNTTAICVPEKHYMVDLTSRIEEIKKMVDRGEYFTINRSRQYGKTTVLTALSRYLQDDYFILSLDFQSLGEASFKDEVSFSSAFARLIMDINDFGIMSISESSYSEFQGVSRDSDASLEKLFRVINRWIMTLDRDIVLIIDEVDSASNNQVFLDFLAQLRVGYINRDRFGTPAFKSVVLAGVNDIKRLKYRVRGDDKSKENSPWNIAADFNVDLSFSANDIAGMLKEYDSDHKFDIDIPLVSGAIEKYTSGYPYLVSRICKIIDEMLVPDVFASKKDAWTIYGVNCAVKSLVKETNALFQSLTTKINNSADIENSLRRILMNGDTITFNPLQKDIKELEMYGFVKNVDGAVGISNIIFEIVLYNLFLADEDMRNSSLFNKGSEEKSLFIKDGRLDMKMVLERFIATYNQIFGPLKDRFHEKDGRELFLIYLKPIINGTGNYYIEAQTRSNTRTDVIVDYKGEQFVIELKIWRGERYNAKGEQQIIDYMDYFQVDKGYMLSFNFNENKEVGVKEIGFGNKLLVEAML